MKHAQRTAIVTGANRGIGLEVCRQLARQDYRVILTSRDPAKGQAAVRQLGSANVTHYPLDVTDLASIYALRDYVAGEFGAAEALVNNAAVYLDEGRDVLDIEPETLRATLDTNLYGPFLLCQAFVPLMLRRNEGRVVNISSGAGELASLGRYTAAYGLSKAALNALTLIFADVVKGTNVLVNAACPGWVRTEMGGPHAPRSVEQGADTIVWLATLTEGGPNGGFFRNRQPVAW